MKYNKIKLIILISLFTFTVLLSLIPFMVAKDTEYNLISISSQNNKSPLSFNILETKEEVYNNQNVIYFVVEVSNDVSQIIRYYPNLYLEVYDVRMLTSDFIGGECNGDLVDCNGHFMNIQPIEFKPKLSNSIQPTKPFLLTNTLEDSFSNLLPVYDTVDIQPNEKIIIELMFPISKMYLESDVYSVYLIENMVYDTVNSNVTYAYCARYSRISHYNSREFKLSDE